ncbi:MAG: hypothetical protein IKP74_02275, partial [Clostridia bacterium]|nr:hypothetical protein [Clostridia bacterium]
MKTLPFAYSPAFLAFNVPARVLYCILAVLLLFIVIVFVVFVLRRKKKNAKASAAEAKAEEPVTEPAPKETPETTEVEDVRAEEPISLRESIAVAKHGAHSANWNKKAIAEDLRARHAGEIEVNERVNQTTTGLPLADTHYAVDHKKKKCFVYVYETEGSPMLLINADGELAAQ